MPTTMVPRMPRRKKNQATATAAPLPDKSAAYTDIQNTGAGVWQ